MTLSVVLATHNQGKVEEFRAMIARDIPDVTVVAYDGPEPVEDGTSFAENALIKARAAARHTGLVALADDSGLCVDVLGGSPGLFSARWAGHGRGAVANYELLLDQIADIADPHRGAHFRCTIALVVPGADGEPDAETVVDGRWSGRIGFMPTGSNGHGYDPVFIPAGHEVSAAELSADEKNALSHRGLAFEALRPALADLHRGRLH